MAAFRRHEAWDHTASVIAAVHQSACTEENKIIYPQQFHPGYVAVKEDVSGGDSRLPVGAVPQEMIFKLMKTTMVGQK